MPGQCLFGTEACSKQGSRLVSFDSVLEFSASPYDDQIHVKAISLRADLEGCSIEEISRPTDHESSSAFQDCRCSLRRWHADFPMFADFGQWGGASTPWLGVRWLQQLLGFPVGSRWCVGAG